jgi:tripartite-type tricarboxylate transporter receptor subunit TctC
MSVSSAQEGAMVRAIGCFSAFLFVLLATEAAEAQWTKPLRIISTTAAGDGTDLVLRRAGADLSPRLGQPIIVENRPGATGIIAAEACAKASPDGHTICHVNPSALSFNPHLQPKLPYDPDRDFRPVTNMFFLIGAVFVKDSVPAASMKEFQTHALANPGKIDFGTLGANVSVDVFRQWLNDQWKTQIVGIPYKGSANMMNALLSGEVQATWIGIYSALGLIKAGKVRMLAVDTPRRSSMFPDVPTLAEIGLPDCPLITWHGLVAPAAVSDPVIRRLNAEVVRLFAEPAYEELFVQRQLLAATSSPEEFGAYLKKDRERAGEVVRRFGLKP